MDTRMHIRMFQSQSVRQCLMLGKLYEMAHPRKATPPVWSQTKQSVATKAVLPYKKEVDYKEGLIVNKDKPLENQPRKFLS